MQPDVILEILQIKARLVNLNANTGDLVCSGNAKAELLNHKATSQRLHSNFHNNGSS